MRSASKLVLLCGGTLAITTITTGFTLAGPINPPAGPVAGTYKTINEVRPGRAIRQSDLPFVISQAGEYYFAENLEGAPAAGSAVITVALSEGGTQQGSVRIDMNGFSLRWAGNGSASNATSYGIFVNGVEGAQITIANGHISRMGTGIQALNGLTVENVNFAWNGVFPDGGGLIIESGTQTAIRNCTFIRNSWGARFNNSTTQNQYGGSIMEDCLLTLNSNGVLANSGVTLRRCTLTHTIFNALQLYSDNIVENCILQRNYANVPSTLELVGDNNTVRDCVIENNFRGGLRIAGNNNTVYGNTIVANAGDDFVNGGLQVFGTASGNIVRDNIVKNNTASAGATLVNYVFTSSGKNQYDLLLSQIPQTINVPANVTLTGNLVAPGGQSGITIASDGVSINLNGHTISGSGGFGGILTSAPERRAITIRNGTIRGFVDGIALSDSSTVDIRDITVSGVTGRGISANYVANILNCHTTNTGHEGIFAADGSVLRGNQVDRAGEFGNFDAIVAGPRSIIESNRADIGSGGGIRCGDNSTVRENTTSFFSGRGINAGNGCIVQANNVRANSLDGIAVQSGCRVVENQLDGNGGAGGFQGGILAVGTGNFIADNTLSANDQQIYTLASPNTIIRNNCRNASGTNFNVFNGDVGNVFGLRVGTGSSTVNTTSNANFSY